jgi:transposase
MRPPSLQTLPVNTACAARSVFSIENLYLAIGDQVGSMFADLNLDHLDAHGEKPANTLFVLAMVTLFQFAEDLPDREAGDAVRTRLDWKYALHLPLDYPGLEASTLGEFRRRLRLNTDGQQVFRLMLNRLAAFGLFGSEGKRRADVIDVLAAIDTFSRTEEVARAMGLALEALASRRPEWLRRTSLPHWYGRYDCALPGQRSPGSRADQDALVQAIGADISYLLEAIAKADEPDLALLPEVQALRRTWREQYELCESETWCSSL